MPRLRVLLVLLAILASTVNAGPAASQITSTRGEALGHAIERSLSAKGALIAPKACQVMDIACGQTIDSDLTEVDHDCGFGIWAEAYLFSGQSGQTVTVDLTTEQFDAYLFLLDPTPEVVAEDDNSGSEWNARIVYTLDQTSSDWSIVAASFFEVGPYTLSLQCSGGPPPPPPSGFFSDPKYPDFRFRVTIGNPGDTRLGRRESNCVRETVCVSGAIPGRSEVFLRILRRRPNGYLWPTIVRFTPSRVMVEIRQVSTDETRIYTLPAVPPGVDELSGLQDRTGFLP